MSRIFAWLISPFVLLLAVAAWSALIGIAWQKVSSWSASVFIAVLVGFGARAVWALLCQRFGRDNPFAFIDTLEHELTHALFGYLTLNPPISLKASLQGEGEVVLKGQNPFTLLAPYFFPLFAMLAAGLTALMAHTYRMTWVWVSLALLGSFMFRLMAEYRWRQSDLHAYGVFFSTCMVALILPLMLGTFAGLLGLMPWSWFLQVPGETRDLVISLIQFFGSLRQKA